MFKSLLIGIFGIVATLGGLWFNQYVNLQPSAEELADAPPVKPVQVKTEMTGVPVVVDGDVTGYLVFQMSSTVDPSKLSSPDLDVVPYIIDAGIRASYQSTEAGVQKFNAVFVKKLSDLVREEANKKLNGEAVLAVNIEQFNFVPKEEIRGNAKAGGHK